MNPIKLISSIYLGDRVCKAIHIDTWGKTIKLQVDCISRVRNKTWNFYTDEDLYDGLLVFGGVNFLCMDPAGFIPNDLIHDIQAEEIVGASLKYRVIISVDAVDSDENYTNVKITIHAKEMWLEDINKPGVRISV